MDDPAARPLVLAVDDWPGHLPGQHVDVRLTAPDGYTVLMGANTYRLMSGLATDGEPGTGALADLSKVPEAIRGGVRNNAGGHANQAAGIGDLRCCA